MSMIPILNMLLRDLFHLLQSDALTLNEMVTCLVLSLLSDQCFVISHAGIGNHTGRESHRSP